MKLVKGTEYFVVLSPAAAGQDVDSNERTMLEEYFGNRAAMGDLVMSQTQDDSDNRGVRFVFTPLRTIDWDWAGRHTSQPEKGAGGHVLEGENIPVEFPWPGGGFGFAATILGGVALYFAFTRR